MNDHSRQPPENTSSIYLDMFSRISAYMLEADTLQDFMDVVLADVVKTMDVSRAFVFALEGDAMWSNTYEAVAEGFAPEIHNLQGIDASEMDENSMLNQNAKGNMYIVPDVSKEPDPVTREILAAQGIMAVVTVPIFEQGKVLGMFGLDQCVHVPDWTEEVIVSIMTLGSLFTSAMCYFESKHKVQRKREQMQSLFDAIPVPIYVADMHDYSILFYNRVIRDNFDVSNIAEKKCYQVFQNLDHVCPFCTNQHLRLGDPPYVWHHHNTLVQRDYKVIDSCVAWERMKKARFSIAVDITDHLRAHRDHILEQEANIAKGRFVANMSHELRTPLNGIVGLTHLADNANTDSVVKDYLDKIKFSSRSLLGVINDTLDFSDVENGSAKLEKHPFCPKEIFVGIQSVLQIEADRKGIGLEIYLDDAVPDILEGDSLRFFQILLNLSSNAVKFTEKGCVRLALHAQTDDSAIPKHTLAESECGCGQIIWVRFEVQDTGIGISEQHLKNLFSEFSQANASISHRYGGTGLGLTIAKHLLEGMGGDISIQSTLGKGSTFTCILPLYAGSVSAIKAEIQDAADISGMHILLVEDNDINALIAREILESYGCHVHSVENGREAIDALEKQLYDIVLMDIQMPVMDGLEATRYLRADTRFDTVPIVAMTAHATKQDYDKSHEVGMQGHLTKPFAPEALCCAIANYAKKNFRFVRECS